MVLQGSHIDFRFGKTEIFNSFHFNFEDAGVSIIQGRNGSGKSTLLLLCAGILLPLNGQITFDELDSDNDSCRYRESVYWLPEDPGLPELTVRDFLLIDEGKSLQNYETSLLNKQISSLSRGEKQKIYLDKALDSKASLLLLDEPFLGLDSQEQQQAVQKIRKKAETNMILLTTHSRELAEQCGDSFFYLSEGRLEKIIKSEKEMK